MNALTLDRVARQVATPSSRRSTLALGAVMAATLARPAAGKAGKAGKKAKKQARKRCQQQVAQCQDVLPGLCAGDPNCLGLLRCCDLFGQCNTTGALACFASSGQ
jgi:hypothetical protein